MTWFCSFLPVDMPAGRRLQRLNDKKIKKVLEEFPLASIFAVP